MLLPIIAIGPSFPKERDLVLPALRNYLTPVSDLPLQIQSRCQPEIRFGNLFYRKRDAGSESGMFLRRQLHFAKTMSTRHRQIQRQQR